MKPNILNIGLFLFWFLGFKFQNLEDRGGTTTTPLLSAECQIRDCEVFRPLVSRVIAIFHKGTFGGHFEDILRYVCVYCCFIDSKLVHLKKRSYKYMSRKSRIQISLTDEQIEELERLAKEKGFTKSAIIALAIEEYKKGQKNA